jgi:hypothetical protein
MQLDLSGLRHQEIRAVPDPARDVEEARVERSKFPGVAPDHHAVALLTDGLSQQGYYVKRVVENPAQASREKGVINRFWDIAGRRYNGVHPIDFHLVLIGDEVQPGSEARPLTVVRLTVRGAYANADMEKKVLDEQLLLWERIRASLNAARSPEADRPRTVDEPIDAADAEVARLRLAIVTLREQLYAAAHEQGELRTSLVADLIALIDQEFGVEDSR